MMEFVYGERYEIELIDTDGHQIAWGEMVSTEAKKIVDRWCEGVSRTLYLDGRWFGQPEDIGSAPVWHRIIRASDVGAIRVRRAFISREDAR